MKYKIGYFYNLPHSDYHDHRIIAVFEGGHLAFRLLDCSIVPRMHYSNMSYYSFDYPVLYLEDSSGNISSYQLISNLPVRYKSQPSGQGTELFIPFWDTLPTNNPCKLMRKTCGWKVSDDLPGVNIFIDGESLIKEIGSTSTCFIKESSKYDLDDLSNVFYRCVIVCHIMKQIICSIKGDAFRLGLFHYLGDPDKRVEDFYLSAIDLAKEYVNSFKIEDLLNGLAVEVSEHFRHKIGDDDGYSVTRKATVTNPIANNDFYLKQLIGIGIKETYSDRGFCSAESMRIKGLVTGFYQGEELEKEKKRIIESYSKEEHLGYILSECFSAIMKNQHDLVCFEEVMMKYRSSLDNWFHLDFISNSDRGIEKMFYPLHSRFEKDPQGVINSINAYIRDKTMCSVNEEEIEGLIKMRIPYKFD